MLCVEDGGVSSSATVLSVRKPPSSKRPFLSTTYRQTRTGAEVFFPEISKKDD